jgi:hypothetical protein
MMAVLKDNGVGIKVAQERLGHSRPETILKHYVHLSPHKADAAADAISAALAVRKERSWSGRRRARSRRARGRSRPASGGNCWLNFSAEPVSA